MDGSSLVTQVEFDEVKKGYDPEQVENYLEQLGERLTLLATNLRKAVDRAEAAEARAVAALKERDAAVERAEAAERRTPTGGGGDDGTESIKKMLMLAQRTADSAVEEAQASAKNIVADARSKAAEIVGDAEQRAERLLIEAQKVGDEMMQEKSAAIVRTVSQLEGRRDDLLADTAKLTAYLDEHRTRVAETLASLQAAVAAGGGLRPAPVPDLEVAPDAPRAADLVAAEERDAPAPRPSGGPGGGGGGGGASAPSPAGPSAAPASGGAPGGSPSAPSAPSAGTVPITPSVQEAPRRPEGGEPRASLLVADPAAAVDAPTIAPEVRIEPGAERPPLFDAAIEAPEIVDPTTETRELSAAERAAVLADGDPLGPTDAISDEAMRKFFEEEPDDGRRRRFRRS